MGRVCAVPKCKTGYKSVKEKRSVFAVPKNSEQFKKWQAAIPGIVLKQSHFVCEKHFEQKFVLKEWVKHDSEGRIMAKVPYLHRRLAEFAVPTIFDNSTPSVPSVSVKSTDEGSNSLEKQSESLEKPVMDDTPNAECAGASCKPKRKIQHKVLPVTPASSAALASSKEEVVGSASTVRWKNMVLSKVTINNLTSNVTSEKNVITIPTSQGMKGWVKLDSKSQFISKVPYLHRKLVEFAVPIIFDNSKPSVPSVSDKPTDDDSNSQENQCESLEKPLMDDTPNAECASQGTIQHEREVLPDTPASSAALASPNQEGVGSAPIVRKKNLVLSKITINNLKSNVTRGKNAITKPTSRGVKALLKHDSKGRIIAKVPYLRRLVKLAVPKISHNSRPSVPSVSDKPTDDGSDSLENQCESLETSLMETTNAECADASCAIPCAPQETNQHEVLPVTPVPEADFSNEEVDSASMVRRENFVISKITINDSTSNLKKNAITIPSSWGVTEYADERGQNVVFSNILRANTNIMIINKSVEVEADKTLRYCVYGSYIDPESYELPPVLTDMSLLPKTLERFRRMNVCQGLGTVNIHHLSVDCVFQDSVQRWRNNDCTILAKQKRCVHCRKMRQCILQRELRSNKTENIHRVRHLSNPIDRRKLIAIRKRIAREKRANNYLKQRVKSLTKALKLKAKEISSIRAEALDNKTVIICVE